MTWNEFKQAVDAQLEHLGVDGSIPIWYIDARVVDWAGDQLKISAWPLGAEADNLQLVVETLQGVNRAAKEDTDAVVHS